MVSGLPFEQNGGLAVVVRGADKDPRNTIREFVSSSRICELWSDLSSALAEETRLIKRGLCNIWEYRTLPEFLDGSENVLFMQECAFWLPANALASFFTALKVEDTYGLYAFSNVKEWLPHSQGVFVAWVLQQPKQYWTDSMKRILRVLVHLGDTLQRCVGGPCQACMASVYTTLTRKQLQEKLESTLKNGETSITHRNGPHNYVMGGNPGAISRAIQLMEVKGDTHENLAIPYSLRSPVVKCNLLPVSVAGHNNAVNGHSVDELAGNISQAQYRLTNHCNVMMRGSEGDLWKSSKGEDCTLTLCECIISHRVDWNRCLMNVAWKDGSDSPANIVDIGPGDEKDGFFHLLQKQLEGKGISILCGLSGVITQTACWKSQWQRGKSPIVVGGMTPITSDVEFVKAVRSQNVEIELAGGGFPTPESLRDACSECAKVGELPLRINLMYANQRLWNLLFPAVLEMRREGVDIRSITIAAGIPPEKSIVEIFSRLAASGIFEVNLKPANRAAILKCCDIAKRFPDMLITVQWTGGCSGGHHSWEHNHLPLLHTYSLLRSIVNTRIVAGGGVGSVNDVKDWLSGKWSSAYGYPPMPVDGALVGTRALVCKESCLSEESKMLICETRGSMFWDGAATAADDSGVISIRSELGEPIHVVENAATKFWKSLDSRIFEQPANLQYESMKKNSQFIIEGIKELYMKRWFGDVEKMTSLDVLDRFEECCCYCPKCAKSEMCRDERRLRCLYCGSDGEFFHPHWNSKFIRLAEAFSSTESPWLSYLEIRYFVDVCKDPVEKTVPFIPRLDIDLEFWLKKDTLWYSMENGMAMVPRREVDRVLILQGPVATASICWDDLSKTIGSVLESLVPIECGIIQSISNPVYPIKCVWNVDTRRIDSFSQEFVEGPTDETEIHVHVEDSLPLDVSVGVDFHFQWNSVRSLWTYSPSESWRNYAHTLQCYEEKIEELNHSSREWTRVIPLLSSSGCELWNNAASAFRTACLDFQDLHGPASMIGALHVRQVFRWDTGVEDMETRVKITTPLAHVHCRRNDVLSSSVFRIREAANKEEIPLWRIFGEEFEEVSPMQLRSKCCSVEWGHRKEFVSPGSSCGYASLSRDFNPIHRDTRLAKILGMNVTVVHGMHMTALCLSYIDEISSWLAVDVEFIKPVHHGVRVCLMWKRVPNSNLILFQLTQYLAEEQEEDFDVYLVGTLSKRRGKTAWIFTGQGALRANSDWESLLSDSCAASVYSQAARHLKRKYSMDIDMLRLNPRRLTVLLNEEQRRVYSDLFPGDANVELGFFIWYHHEGLLYATQFMQLLSLLWAKCEWEIHSQRGEINLECDCFAGHSLGEYAVFLALSSIPLNQLLDLVLWRGIIMQRAVPRDSQGVSPFAMVAVNPKRLSRKWADIEFEMENLKGDGILEAVNFNSPDRQVVVAGNKSKLSQLAIALKLAVPWNQPQSGWIPLSGVDVPFHSTALRGEVPTFRILLQRVLGSISLSGLVRKYVPNVTGQVLEDSVEYWRSVRAVTNSPYLGNEPPEDRENRLRVLVTELLAYQFASPVQWIQTIKTLESVGCESVCEVGPQKILSRMLQREGHNAWFEE